MFKINILTIFPEYFSTSLETSILGRAQKNSHLKFNVINIRDYTTDKHKTADDRPYGGGPGMVMKVEPIFNTLDSLGQTQSKPRVIRVLTSAQGQSFTQKKAQQFAQVDELTIVCGHYEGVDERVAEHLIDQEIRIGDYVLTGGEPAAMVITDAVARLIPNVLGNEKSNLDESHAIPGQLGFPQYTRPSIFNNWSVPKVLLTGDHGQIDKWRVEQKK